MNVACSLYRQSRLARGQTRTELEQQEERVSDENCTSHPENATSSSCWHLDNGYCLQLSTPRQIDVSYGDESCIVPSYDNDDYDAEPPELLQTSSSIDSFTHRIYNQWICDNLTPSPNLSQGLHNDNDCRQNEANKDLPDLSSSTKHQLDPSYWSSLAAQTTTCVADCQAESQQQFTNYDDNLWKSPAAAPPNATTFDATTTSTSGHELSLNQYLMSQEPEDVGNELGVERSIADLSNLSSSISQVTRGSIVSNSSFIASQSPQGNRSNDDAESSTTAQETKSVPRVVESLLPVADHSRALESQNRLPLVINDVADKKLKHRLQDLRWRSSLNSCYDILRSSFIFDETGEKCSRKFSKKILLAESLEQLEFLETTIENIHSLGLLDQSLDQVVDEYRTCIDKRNLNRVISGRQQVKQAPPQQQRNESKKFESLNRESLALVNDIIDQRTLEFEAKRREGGYVERSSDCGAGVDQQAAAEENILGGEQSGRFVKDSTRQTESKAGNRIFPSTSKIINNSSDIGKFWMDNQELVDCFERGKDAPILDSPLLSNDLTSPNSIFEDFESKKWNKNLSIEDSSESNANIIGSDIANNLLIEDNARSDTDNYDIISNGKHSDENLQFIFDDVLINDLEVLDMKVNCLKTGMNLNDNMFWPSESFNSPKKCKRNETDYAIPARRGKTSSNYSLNNYLTDNSDDFQNLMSTCKFNFTSTSDF